MQKQYKKDTSIFLVYFPPQMISIYVQMVHMACMLNLALQGYFYFQALICTTKMPDPNELIINTPEHLICHIVMTDKIQVPNCFNFVCNLTVGHAGTKTRSHLFDTVHLLNCWRCITSCDGNDKISKCTLRIYVHK